MKIKKNKKNEFVQIYELQREIGGVLIKLRQFATQIMDHEADFEWSIPAKK